jgi:hypothetical protein
MKKLQKMKWLLCFQTEPIHPSGNTHTAAVDLAPHHHCGMAKGNGMVLANALQLPHEIKPCLYQADSMNSVTHSSCCSTFSAGA